MLYGAKHMRTNHDEIKVLEKGDQPLNQSILAYFFQDLCKAFSGLHNKANTTKIEVQLNFLKPHSNTNNTVIINKVVTIKNLLIHIVTRCNKFSTYSWVIIISSSKAPMTTGFNLEWQRLGPVPPSSNLQQSLLNCYKVPLVKLFERKNKGTLLMPCIYMCLLTRYGSIIPENVYSKS